LRRGHALFYLLGDHALVSWDWTCGCFGMSWLGYLFPFLSCPNSGFVWIFPVVEGSFHLWFGWLSNSYSNYWSLGFSHHLPPVGAFVVWVIGLVSSLNYFLCYTGKQWVFFGEIVYSLFSLRISSYLSFVAFPFSH